MFNSFTKKLQIVMDPENSKFIKVSHKTVTDVVNELNEINDKLSVINLIICHCELFTLQKQYLNEFANLINLELSNNAIFRIENNVFNSLIHLKTINLSHNYICDINDNVFAENLNLKNVDLSQNMLIEIRPLMFANLLHLESLDLSYNKIIYLKSHCLSNEMLKFLKLSHNVIYKISDSAFDKLPNLNYLELNHNYISRINSKMFAKTLMLIQLYLNDNLIVDMSKNAFGNLRQLNGLHLEDNLITCIEDIFLSNINLRTLDLGDNDIRLINRNVFQNNASLTYLRLVTVQEFQAYSIYHLKNLQFFELVYEIDSKCPILMALIAVLLKKPNLLILRIIYKHSYNYASLVRFNALTSLEKLHIECLNVDEKLLKINICSQLKRMRNLRNLTLKNINLLNIPFENEKDFEMKLNLQFLNLSGLKNTFIDDMFNDFPLLEELNLSLSDISVIDDNAFESLIYLEHLNLGYCKLRCISSKLFRNNSNLKTINFENNRIETIDDYSFANLNSLELLDLRGNEFGILLSEVFVGLGDGTQVLLNYHL